MRWTARTQWHRDGGFWLGTAENDSLKVEQIVSAMPPGADEMIEADFGRI